MAKRGGSAIETFVFLLIALFVIVFLYLSFKSVVSGYLNSFLYVISNATSTIVSQNITGGPTPTTVEANTSVSSSDLVEYALSLINKDRKRYGLQAVTLSNQSSGQQHAQSMLVGRYISHWDPYGLKPYMRYTLLGGTDAVDENVAYRFSNICGLLGCIGNMDAKQALESMEYTMLYNDSTCCKNGHRDNILDPYHNQVSIGVAYNSSTVYFVEDFIDNYITWRSYGPNTNTDEMYLSGSINNAYLLSSVLIAYDSPIQSMTRAQLINTSSYDNGNEIAGVVGNPRDYYPGITTIVADQYSVSGNQLNMAFNMRNLITKGGAGEYTVLVWLNDTTGKDFISSSYTLFVGSDGKIYVPDNI